MLFRPPCREAVSVIDEPINYKEANYCLTINDFKPLFSSTWRNRR